MAVDTQNTIHNYLSTYTEETDIIFVNRLYLFNKRAIYIYRYLQTFRHGVNLVLLEHDKGLQLNTRLFQLVQHVSGLLGQTLESRLKYYKNNIHYIHTRSTKYIP